MQVDVGHRDQIDALIATAEERNGEIDIFFSNAGITGASGGPPDLTDDDWDLLHRVNVMSHIWAARNLIPKMLDRGEGYLISTASAAGLLTQLGALGYAATKHAAVAIAEWIDITYRDQGIRASCLCPQFVNTPMVTEGLDVEKLKQIATIIEPEQVADDVVAGDQRGALPDPPPRGGRALHAQPRLRPRPLAARDAPAAGPARQPRAPRGVASAPWTTARCRSACGRASRGSNPCSAARPPAASSWRSTAWSPRSSPRRPTRRR